MTGMRRGMIIIGLAGVCAPGAAPAQGARLIERAEYESRLRGLWLGEVIANWTGRRAEGQRTNPPFPTDADWGTDLGRGVLEFVLQDPWLADDDTDIEYVYAHLLRVNDTSTLTGAQIRDGWVAHINDFIWVSNETARDLMDRGVTPPSTGMGAPNVNWLKIDAQLTTELFGALAPGNAAATLEMADLPIRATSAGHATHASQAHALMHTYGAIADPELPEAQRVRWVIERARAHIPDSSKAADIMDFVMADFDANPDVDDWERTRDLVYERYQLNDAANGFDYRSWTESSVNFASTIVALLYGQGDYRRTVQIATLCGWDADNPASTAGGLLGLMQGDGAIEAAFPGETLSDRFDILRTRDDLPLWIQDPEAQDTLTLLAQRCADEAQRATAQFGGLVDEARGRWLVAPESAAPPAERAPTWREWARSANNTSPGGATASPSVTSNPPSGYGSRFANRFANGFEQDFSGVEPGNGLRQWWSSLGGGTQPDGTVTLEVTYSAPVAVDAVRFIEGDHFPRPGGPTTYEGGWFQSAAVEVRIGGVWTAPPGAWSEAFDSATPWQILDFELDAAVMADGVRVRGVAGGADAFVTCAELDALAPVAPAPMGTFDRDGRGSVDMEDLYTHHRSPVDLDGDGAADGRDVSLIESAVRWTEQADSTRAGQTRRRPAGDR